MIICFTFTKKSDQIYVCISDDMRLLLNIIGGRGQLVRTQDTIYIHAQMMYSLHQVGDKYFYFAFTKKRMRCVMNIRSCQ